MTGEKRTKYLLLAAGSLLVGLSGAIVGTSAFSQQTIQVFLGYSLFVVAYKTCWYGVHQEGGLEGVIQLLEKGVKESIDSMKDKPWNYLMIILGVYLCSYGTVEFTRLVENPEIVTGLKTGIACFTGYIIAHEGVNEVPL